MDPLTVWVVDDDASIRWVLEKAFARDGMTVRSFAAATELLGALQQERPDVLVSDIRMPGLSGLDLMQRVTAQHPQLPVIIMTAHSDLDAAVAAYKGGAFEYLPKPFDVDAVAALVRRAARERTLATEAPPLAGRAPLIGEAPAMQDVFRAIGRLSASEVTVLITGETGVGKELVARALHQHSPRAGRSFIAVNTAAIPKELLESEFFGHERGAFTGAQTQRKGRFEQADGGTLFLDEIGEMPTALQTRLLRVLADGEFYRVGGTLPVKVDVRVIAATNRDLETEVREGTFREDLFHRLNVIRIRIPALRERPDDIPELTRHFLHSIAAELKTAPKRLRPEALERLRGFSWPGNVRQLENLCRWLTVMAPGQDIDAQDLPAEIRNPASPEPTAAGHAERGDASGPAVTPWAAALRSWAQARLRSGDQDLLAEALPAFERTLIQAALAECKGQRIEAARRLGWGRNTLTRKIKELGLE